MLDQLLLLAFGAGVLGFFAPCSVAMLPAYVSYFLGQRDLGFDQEPGGGAGIKDAIGGLGLLVVAAGLALASWAVADLNHVLSGQARISLFQSGAMGLGALFVIAGFYLAAPRGGVMGGLAFGLITTLGILLAYLVLGLVVIILLGLLTFTQMAWGVIAVGALLVVMGVLALVGRGVAFTVPVKAPRRRSAVGFFLFGIAYGIVSLGCNLPLIGFPVAAAAAGAGTFGGILGFLAYGAGAGILMIILSVSVASSRGLTAARIQRIMPILRPLTGIVLVAAGSYIIWYAWANFLSAGT
jgi:cytochrome c biogenesis protein CcdA